MRFITLLFISFSLLLTNCKGDTVSEVIEETQEEIDARKISQKDIESFRYADFGLSSDAQKAVTDWQKFQELNTQIELLKKSDLSFFNGDLLLLKTFLTELRTEMPEQLQTNEINARITALDTKGQKLNSLLTINNISKEEKLQGIKELLIAVSNLNLQINKKFEFDKNNVFKPE
ncbi:hypothetical protein [uncultured Psychroserpens sp.]|uniref:hypothetical protein n=1 Tax=uncultured Psychroserpens sp. TaxID=255436 RepID=UPI00262D9470|nr:hypothetical protein [uncultured Psychroserpens sp.]